MLDIILDLLFSIYEQVFSWVLDFFVSLFDTKPQRKTILDSDFSNEKDLLSSENHGFCLTGKRSLSIKDSHSHALVLGGSGSGKSVTTLIPSIYNIAKGGSSMVIHDPSMELAVTSGFLEKLGYKVKILQYSNSTISEGFNPMSRIANQSDIQKLASMLVRNTLGSGGDSIFWNSQAQNILAFLFTVLRKQSKEYQNLYNAKYILDLMQGDPNAMDLLVANCVDDYILKEYKNILQIEKKVLSNIISTCRSALLLYSDPSVATITSFDSFSFEEFREGKLALFIQNSTADIKYYATLTSIFTEQFFGYIMSKIPNKNSRSIFFLLDESSSLYIPSISIAVANLRKFSCGVMLVGQDFHQFENIYNTNDAQAIKSNMYAKVYFPGQSLKICQELSTLLGQYEFKDEETGNRRQRKLLEPNEIYSMKPNSALVFCGSRPAIYAQKMLPYFEHPEYKKYTNIPQPEFGSKVPFLELPTLPVPVCN